MNDGQAGSHRIVVTGASGFIGRALVAFLQGQGHTVRTLGRGSNADIRWDPARAQLDPATLAGTEVAIHLAGEALTGRWTTHKRQVILDSRVKGTELLAKALATRAPRPRVLIPASAVGFYGDRGGDLITEEDGPGAGFLPQVCVAWETATQAAEQAGIRVVHLRLGIVASSHGGAFPQMLLPFRLGLGQPLGNGRQYLSWIALPDLLRVIVHCQMDETLRGAVNAVAPEPVTNAEFSRVAADLLHRWTLPGLPAFALRAALGKMADEVLLASTRAVPQRLLQSGFSFGCPSFAQALRGVIEGSI
ncbi:MAG: TIGR01777 family oxidoreductase [Armatimonadota bacterium]